MLDCIIENGVVVDGTGAPGERSDVGIRDGVVVEVGTDLGPARRRIDVGGQVVAPGFIDVHTHYDAQIMWDPAVAPSSLHGVTTVIGGNCGFTIAPIDDDSADYVMRMLACVEGMPVECLEAALDFDWRSTGEWFGRLDGAVAVNAGFLTGHSTIRKLVMGSAWQEPADDGQVARMAALVSDALDAGALGFSSSWGSIHGDHLGNMVPSRYAASDELVTLASVLRGHPGTMLEFIPPSSPSPRWSDETVDVMIAMSRAARSPLNWNLLTVGMNTDHETNDARLAASTRAAASDARIVALTVPTAISVRVTLASTILYNFMPAWQQVMSLAPAERLRALADPDVRRTLTGAVDERRRAARTMFTEFDDLVLESVHSPALRPFVGRTLVDIARERGTSALDAFLDISLDDELASCFRYPPAADDADSWQRRVDHWHDPRVLIGGSDAGAHLDQLSTFGFFSDFVGPVVRERGLISLEAAVQKITDTPARFYGLRDRGRLRPGYRADIVVFDPERVRAGDVTLRADMPASQSRLYSEGVAIERVLVNGVEIVHQGALTGATPGTILRSGIDTDGDLR